MLDSALELLRSFTNPERLIGLLSTVLSGWLGYAALIGIVFAETGLLVGFFLPGDSLLFTVGVVAGAGQLNIVLINVVLMAAASTWGVTRDRRFSTGPIRGSSSRSTCTARKPSTKSTAARRSSTRGSCRSSARSRRSWRAWRG
jgi:hypothetical protein